MGDQPTAKPLPTQYKQTELGFEPGIKVFEWQKKLNFLDHAATVIGNYTN
jgi:hypothetical protein